MNDQEYTPLAQEMTAQVQLGLLGTVGKLSRQLRAIDRIAPMLRDGGVVRKITIDREKRRRTVGISEAQRCIQAFGGLLYGVASVSHQMTTAGSDIAHTGQKSRLDVGDMSLLEYERRLDWRTYLAVYDLLSEIFRSEELPDLVMLGIPLVFGRKIYAQVIGDAEETDAQLKEEVDKLRDRIESFWNQNRSRCFPYDPKGPKVVSLHRGRLREPIKAIQGKGVMKSPDTIDPEVERMMKSEWVQILSVVIERVLLGILTPDHRTAAFETDQSKADHWAFPRALIEGGTLTFHYLTGLRGQPVHVEALGAASAWHELGGSKAVDDLAGDLMALTYFDHRTGMPLPAWYALQAVNIVKKRGILEFYKREALRAMQDEQVDRSWLAGWEE